MPLRSKTTIPIKAGKRRPPRVRAAALPTANPPMLSVPYIRQQQTQWCWAACAEMVAAFLNKPPVKQCDLANFLHGQTNCCVTPGSNKCNRPSPTAGIAAVYGHLGINCVTNTWPVSAAVVLRELQNGRPVEIGYLWFGGGGHVAIIRGITPQGFFAVNDPWFGAGVYAYQALYFAYGRGRWALTFGDFR